MLEEFMETFDFKNKKTEKLHKKLLKKDKGDFQQFLDSKLVDLFDGGYNGKNNDTTIKFDCFQAIELYSRANKKKIEKMFSKFVTLCNDNEGKYRRLKNDANENVQKIIDRVDHSYTAWLIDFRLKCNLKYVSFITMTLDCMGPNLFKLVFNCSLSDLAKYKYWLYACLNVQKEL